MSDPLFLTDTEIDALCAPLTQPAAQIRYLRSLGLLVKAKPNGRAIVVRSHAEAVLSGRRETRADDAPATVQPGPNIAALRDRLNARANRAA